MTIARVLARIVLLACLLGLVASQVRADDPAAAPPSERELHVAKCVAALDAQTRSLAQQLKAGQESVRAELTARLEAGVAFVGDAYLHGNRDEARARGLAEQSREEQKSLNDAERTALQTACAEEGAGLMAASSGLGRLIVRRVAKKRLAKLLEE